METSHASVSVPQPLTEPTWQPVTLEEAKHQLRISPAITVHDNQIHRLIRTARLIVERETNYIFERASYLWTLPGFPEESRIRLPRRNVTGVESVTYNDRDGQEQTFTDWEFIEYYVWPEVILADVNESWPEVDDTDPQPVKIQFLAGYINSGAVPNFLKDTLLSLVSAIWDPIGNEKNKDIYAWLSQRIQPGYYSP